MPTPENRLIQEDDEISLVDVVRFFSARVEIYRFNTLKFNRDHHCPIPPDAQTIPEAANLINQPSSYLRLRYPWHRYPASQQQNCETVGESLQQNRQD